MSLFLPYSEALCGGGHLRLCMKECSLLYAGGRYVLPPLPYAESALEPVLDAETLCLHHDRHHAAYVAGANAALERLHAVAEGELPESAAREAAHDLSFHLAGHFLHTLYWKSLSPEPLQVPQGALAEALCGVFGSYQGFLRVFRGVALGVQGSGWAMLAAERASGRPVVLGLQRHEEGLVPGLCPLLVCDVWEHAYYLRYRNNRASYVEGIVDRLNWRMAEERWENFNRQYDHVCR